jgi:hypothetical protein
MLDVRPKVKQKGECVMVRLIGVCVFATLLSLYALVQGQPNSILLSDGPAYDHDFITASSGLTVVYVVVWSWWGLQAIEFATPPPDCDGVIYLGQSAVFPSTIGSAETGVSIGFGGCRSSMFHVLTLTYYTAGADSCCPMDIIAHPSSISGKIEGVDCQSNTVIVEGMMNTMRPAGMAGCGHPTVPKNPTPPDGTVDVPLTVTLNWDSKPTAGTGLGVFFANVYLGTTTDPPAVIWNELPPQQVGPLAPNTTYYWRVISTVTDYGSTTGPLWTFTTRASVPVKESTWGAIKSLFTSDQ